MANSKKVLRGSDTRDLLAHLRSFLEAHLSSQISLTLGFSGGLDSCVLLNLLSQLRESLGFHLFAVHVNHQISPHAESWAQFCGELCNRLEVPFTAIKVDVPSDSGLGLEAAAREVRYQALLEHCNGALVLAHHMNDQAETVMLQLLRGAGVAGLAAMPMVGEIEGIMLLRPLLEVSRTALYNYAQECGLQWIEDESNLDSRFDRNFLRNEVFPVLAQRFPAYVATLSRSAMNFADSAEVLEQVAEQDAIGSCIPGRLNIAILRTLPHVRAVNVLRWWVNQETGLILSRSRLCEILEQLIYARADAQVECSLGDVVLHRYRQWACVDNGHKIAPYCFEWDGEGALQLPDGSTLSMRKQQGTGMRLEIIARGFWISNRAGKPVDAQLELRLGENRPMRALKNLWQEAGIPAWERERMPLVWQEERLAAVPGIGCNFALCVQGSDIGGSPEWSV